MKTFVVIGLGRFGTAVASELCKMGHEVLAIDGREDHVQAVADKVTHAACGDGRDPDVLRALGVGNYDCGIVSVADDIGTSALITVTLKELGIKEVICKAQSHVHRKVLEKIGADRVLFPEHEMGVKLAQSLSRNHILNYIELSNEYNLVEITPPKFWLEKSLIELDIRAKHKVNIIAVRQGQGGELVVAPGGRYVFQSGDTVLALGRNEHIDALDNHEH